ncbi:MAG: InlB B-repeat-containing protein, partial [Clostridia bacterium]|nr:InlB B-repeat-containing protein [Clostridia bacterium]
TYSESSPEIFGYTADIENVTGTIGIEDVTKMVTYSPKEYDFVVKYEDENGNTLSESVTTKIKYDLEYSLEIKAITGYTPQVEEVTGIVNQNDTNWTENKIEYTVIYSINIYNLTIEYVFVNGETANETLVKQYEYSYGYSEASPEIFGYTADIETVTGTIGTEDTIIKVTYSPKEYDVVAKYEDEEGNTLSESVTTKVNYDAEYSIEIKEITGYSATIDSVSGIVNQNDANWTENKIEYTVIYTINVYNFIINYVHLNGEAASGTLITQYEYNYEYSEASPEIFGYTADIETVTGTIGTEDVTITVTYSPKEYDVVAKYQDENGNTLSEDVITKVNYDADYSIEIKEITGYTATLEEVTGLVNQNDQNWIEDKIEYVVVYAINFYSLTIRYEDEDGSEVGMTYQMSYEYNSIYNVESLVVDGYTVVSGQEVVTGTMGAEDVSVTVSYTTNKYTLTYYVNGLKYNEEKFTIKSEDILLEEIVVDGYTFNGWYVNEELVNSIDKVSQGTYGDLNVYAEQIADKHYVRFYVSVGNGIYELQDDLTEEFTIESSDFELETIEKTGYAFSGWFAEESLTNSFDKVSQGTYVDINVYGNFSVVTYTLTYNEVGYDESNSTLNENITELTDGTLTLSYDIEDFVEGKLDLATLTRTGYIFNGWFTEQTCENSITEINESNIGSKVLYTYFNLNTYDLIIEFRVDSNEGELVYTLPAQQVKYTNSYNVSLQDVSVEGYSFAEDSVEGEMDSEGKTVVVILTANTYDITINFVDEKGNTMFESVVEHDCKFGESYRFDYSDKVVEGYAANLIVEGTLDETAKVINVVYVPNVYQITYYLVEQEGNTIYTQDDLIRTYTILDTITIQTISKTGYTFYGWYSDEECETSQTIITSGSTGNIDLYGYFTINSYKLTIRYEDEEGNEIGTAYEGSYEYNSTYEVESILVDGYTVVAGQEVVTGTMGAGDVSVTVSYTTNEYTLTYYVNGLKYNEQKYTIKSEDITLETIVLNGYTFNGWYSDEDLTTSIDKVSQGTYVDTNVYGEKTAVKHYVRFYVSVEEGNYELQEDLTEEYTIESQDLILQNIDKTGYTFSGWYSDEGLTTSIDKVSQGTYVDTNVYGKFNFRVYNVTYYVDGIVNDTLRLKSFTLLDLTEEIALENLTKTGYTFSGWFTDSEMTTGNEVTSISECKDYVLYSRFDANNYKLVINYSYANGKLPNSTEEIDVAYNQAYNKIIPTVYGYNSNVTTISGTMDENGREVDVIYTPKTFNLVINYSYSDGSYFDSTSSSVITFDENYTEQIPEVYGYNAYENDEMITVISSVLTVEENVNIYIVYKPVKVQLTINYLYLNGQVAKEASVYQVDFAQTYSFEVEKIAGYTPDYDKVTGKVRTITPIVENIVFTSNVYKIYIINTENDEVKSVNVIYNSTVSLKNKFERKGYNFLGWSKTENGKIIYKEGEEFVYNTPNNITIYTVWEKKNNTGVVVAIVLSSVVGAAGLGVGGFFAYKYRSDIALFIKKLFGKNNKKVVKNNKKSK